MLKNASIVAFVAITDVERARRFYEHTLGLTPLRDEPFALVFDANGVTLRLAKVERLSPAPYTVLGWRVPDIAAACARLAAAGVRFEHYEGMQQDEAGIWAAPDGGYVAWFKDPDGNTLSLTQAE